MSHCLKVKSLNFTHSHLFNQLKWLRCWVWMRFLRCFFKNCTKGVWTNPWQWCWILCLEDDDCPFYVFMYLFIYIAQSEICIVFPEIPECLFLFENWKFIAPFFFLVQDLTAISSPGVYLYMHGSISCTRLATACCALISLNYELALNVHVRST